jgi:hypothetical protein
VYVADLDLCSDMIICKSFLTPLNVAWAKKKNIKILTKLGLPKLVKNSMNQILKNHRVNSRS